MNPKRLLTSKHSLWLREREECAHLEESNAIRGERTRPLLLAAIELDIACRGREDLISPWKEANLFRIVLTPVAGKRAGDESETGEIVLYIVRTLQYGPSPIDPVFYCLWSFRCRPPLLVIAPFRPFWGQ